MKRWSWHSAVFLLLWLIQASLWGWDEWQVARIRGLYPGDMKTILSYPLGARVESESGQGLTPCVLGASGSKAQFAEARLAKDGYHPVSVTQQQVIDLQVLVLPRGWPLWLAWHCPALLSLALLPALRRQLQGISQDIEDTRLHKTEEVIASSVFGPGREVGSYRIQDRLGTGATAEVFRALCITTGQIVALKVLHEAVCKVTESRERFDREVRICQELRHPRLVAVLGHGQVKERLWMAQEFVEGSSLEALAFPLPVDKVLQLLDQICEGLAYAHGHDVVHRDLKPANILLRSDGQVVIADFGLARGRHYATITKTDTTLGTPAYMPPEQVQGLPTDQTSDLYSLGCIAYEMLTGEPPFHGDDVVPVLMGHLLEPAPPVTLKRPDTPPDLARVVARLLEKAPGERYASAEELRQVLSRIS